MKKILVPFLLAGSLVTACSPPERKPAVPEDLENQAEVAGLPGVRYMNDITPLVKDAIDAGQREIGARAAQGETGPLPPANYLALSGGGDKGAFGSGLLLGWTAAGTRPEFKLVTGVSTGALIAPFAFLGSKYDDQLKAVYTNISNKDIMRKRGFQAAVMDDALADNAPLWQLAKKYVTAEMMHDIAVEHGKGRMLLIGTTNIDSMKGVLWNVGKIAASGKPEALDLLHRILVASAAIPAAFPPVLIDVEAGGKQYQEMHVDGGATAQVFVYPPAFMLKEAAAAAGLDRERHVWIIRNARLDPDWSDVQRRTLSIAGRAISSLIQTQGRGDLFRIFAVTQRDGVDFNLVYIPATFDAPHPEDFDTGYMRALFQFGYDMAAKGDPWEKAPPGY
jgi:predicted acylesterase/phospholipase RssA